tara:strand:+ start:189 stop:350 length:162 start_codon:yes stop_codon:yes gene_type:complete
MVALPVWLIVVGAIVLAGLAVWFLISALATFFLLTGPPDTFDVDIADKKEKTK